MHALIMKHTLAFLTLLGVATAANNFAGSRPNVLIIFADDMGYGDLGTYGHPTNESPNLDALAHDGIKFTQWYSGFHVCSPSRGAMMTGRLPIRLGLAGSGPLGGVFRSDAVGCLPANETTVADALGAAGYSPRAAVGKWPVSFAPRLQNHTCSRLLFCAPSA